MASLAILASLGSLHIDVFKLEAPRALDHDRRGMASLALLASLGALHIDAFGHVGIV